MTLRSMLRPVGRMMLPLALTATLAGCTVIEAQKMAGEGNRMVEQGKLEDAIKRYEESIARKDNDTAHAGMAEALMRQGRYGEAEQHAKKAIELSPTVPAHKLVLAKAYLLQGQGNLAYEKAQDVVKALSTMMSDPPSKALVKKGRLLQARTIEATSSNVEDAAKLITDPEIQMRWPDDVDFRAELAVVTALQGQYDKAAELAESVLKLNAKHGDALLARGVVLANTGKTSEAKQILGEPLRQDHTRVLVLLQAARKLQAAKKTDDALDLLKLLVEVQPQNHLIHSELAFANLQLGRYEESIKEHEATLQTYAALQPYVSQNTSEGLAKALKDTPPADVDKKNLEVFYENLAGLHEKMKQNDKAILYFEKLTVVSPSLTAYQNLAAAYNRQNDAKGAISALEGATKLDPQNCDLVTSLATLYYQSGQKDKTKDAFSRAAKICPPDKADVHLNYGVVLYNDKQFKDAMEEFQEAVKANASNADAWYYLGLSQRQSKDSKGAEESFKKTVQLKEDYADAYRELGNIAIEKKAYKEAEAYFAKEDKYKGKSPKKKGR